MNLYGEMFFRLNTSDRFYYALPPSEVQDNVKDRAALREFKRRFSRFIANRRQDAPLLSDGDVDSARMHSVLSRYEEGLKQFMVKAHPWVSQVSTHFSSVTDGKDGQQLLSFLPR